MTTLVNVYITRAKENAARLELIIQRLEESGVKVYVALSGRDTEVLVEPHTEERAMAIVNYVLFDTDV